MAEKNSSVVYVSFGSVVVLSENEMEAIATAVKKSKRPFFWFVKKPDYNSPDKSGELALAFKEVTKNQGLIVSWCPQTKVLAHQVIACFITGCGWNSEFYPGNDLCRCGGDRLHRAMHAYCQNQTLEWVNDKQE
ncbi:hypothetical protein Ddye_003554 [Dipteronia dyeriana]|uniref:Uncharacterized protein n=1 Tax=Dipteronia dyeriana TaxID=168575 RepID=A0AAD9XSY8_9ROSI|nr:hypothetical protein Ddye_003554 [Dipteronia dyeriana]